MAKGVDELIDHLLTKIGVTGSRGVTVNELTKLIATFYSERENDSASSAPSADFDPSSGYTLDRALLSKVWSWLGRHPDVSIGDKGSYNKTPLAELEAEFPGYVNLDDSHPSVENEPDIDNSQQASATPNKRRISRKPRKSEGPRIRLCEERVYQTICGHAPDTSKIVPLEFELLCHIAATGSAGILQGDLVRLSGQDKRSVPKRTDRLHTKGYIIKETVFHKGLRTSRLTLKKFAKLAATDAAPFHKLHSLPRNGSTLRDVVRRIFDVLADQKLLPQTSLARELGLESSAKSAVLQKTVRRLEKLKLVKKVRTAVGPSATSSDLQQFVQLVRHAEPIDLQNFDTEKLSLDQRVEELASREDSEGQHESSPALPTVEQDNEDFSRALFKPARWNPDRLMPNILVDAVRSAGVNGLTNLNARHVITGDSVRRQLESLLHRVSCQALVVQPPHLRHLAIVRSTITEDGVTQYIHYSWDAFLQKATENGLNLSEIPGAKQALKSQAEERADFGDEGAVRSGPPTDEFGFPLQGSLALHVRGGEATFSEVIGAAAAGDVEPRNGELIIVREGANLLMRKRDDMPSLSSTTDVAPRRPHPPPRPKAAQRSPNRKRYADEDEDIAIGRPRKYARGTEKFWRLQFKKARLDAGADLEDVKKGNMRDPAAKALYARRPAGFDETLIQALDSKLPIPILPEDIDNNWIDSTRNILDRSSDGVYMSSRGLRSDRNQKLAQVMIVRTPRLASLDLSDRSKVYPFRFLSSSASHSFAFRRYYPNLPAKARSTTRIRWTLKPQVESTPGGKGDKEKTGPQLGVFYEDSDLKTRPSFGIEKPVNYDVPIDVLMDTTDDDASLPYQDNHETSHLSPVSMDEILSSERMQIDHAGSKRGAQRNDRGGASMPETPTAPSSKPEITQTPSFRPSRKRKLTQKAVELVESNQGRSLRLFAETRSSSAEVTVADSDAQDHQLLGSSGRERTGDGGSYSFEEIRDALIQPTRAQDSKHPGVLRFLERIEEATVSRTSSVGNEAPDETTSMQLDVNVSRRSSVAGDSATRKRTSTSGRRSVAKPREPHEPEEEEFQHQDQQSRAKQQHTKGANALCRKIIIQLIQETTGVVPNDPYTLRRISAPRWQEAGEKDRPLLKTMKAAIKSLCESGKLKQIMFTFRGKSGIMVKRSVIFLPTINSASQSVEDVKRKIIDEDPADYIPPEWSSEGYRTPLVNLNALNRAPEIETSLRRRALSTELEARPAKRRRGSSAASNNTVTTAVARGTRSQSKLLPSTPPLPPPPSRETAATSFVTLKVPSLGSLPVVQLYIWRNECPVSALRSDTSTLNPWKSSALLPAKRRRRSRKPDLQAAGRSIVWRNFPFSLKDILQLPDLRLNHDEFLSHNVDWQRFACEVEGVRAWEEQESESALSKRSKYAFINHYVPEVLYDKSDLPSRLKFASLVNFDKDGLELETAYPPVESWPSFAAALQASPDVNSRISGIDDTDSQSMPPPSAASGLRRVTRAPKRRIMDDTVFDPALEPAPKRRRKVIRSAGAIASRHRTLTALITTPQKLSRGDRWLQNMSEDRAKRIAVSIVVIRTLAGGIEGFIDWPIVMTLFPNRKELFIKSSWETLSGRYSSNMEALTEKLQRRYLEAFEAGEVPPVNFVDIKATDWPAIVDWALSNLDHFDWKQVADLPGSRDEFLNSYGLEFDKPKRFHNVIGNSSAYVREDVVKSSVFGTCYTSSARPAGLQYPLHFENEIVDRDLHVAKTWVLAAILTPESVFIPELAQAKLSTLASTPTECEALLVQALKLLEDDKIIQRRPNRRRSEHLGGMRTWEGNQKLFERFEERSLITPDMLRRAVEHKLDILDGAFVKGDIVLFEKDDVVHDGEMVAVLNLMAMGHVRARPGVDVPKTRYGIDHERVGYKSRNIDKKLLGFGVELTPTRGYVHGDPKSEARKTPIPRGKAAESRGPIPAWVDIHGSVQMALWEMFLVSVIGLVSQMPGISALDISRTFGFVIDQAEVELIMQWAVKAGFAKMDDKTMGYQTLEWWWLCIDKAGLERAA